MKIEDRRWCLALSAVLAVLTSVPYLLGYFNEGEAWRFTGFVFAVEDGNSYIAKMLQGASGAWLFRSPYSAFPQQGVIAFIPYILLGKLAAGSAIHEQLVALFHLARILTTPLLVVATYRFASLYLQQRSYRRWATILATAGGGLGWVLVLIGKSSWLGSPPLDFYSPESFGFLSVFGIPHLIVARALLLMAITAFIESEGAPGKNLLAGTFVLLLGLFQPLTMLVALVGIGSFLLASLGSSSPGEGLRRWLLRLRDAGLVLLVPLPLLAYLVWQFSNDPYLRLWTEQNIILSPHPLHYLVAYGLVLIPAIAGAVMLLRRRSSRGLLLVAWLLVLPALAYFPHNLQRRLPEGAWVLLAIFAATALEAWEGRKRTVRVSALIMTLSLLSPALLLAGGLQVARSPSEPIFRPADEVQAFEWLGRESSVGDVVLASYATSNALPAWAPVRVVIGHGPESAMRAELEPQLEALFSGNLDPADISDFMHSQEVRYLFWGVNEKAFGGWNPADSSAASLVYDKGDFQIYEFNSMR